MALYRVMVSGHQDRWEWIQVEADSEEDAREKAQLKFNFDDVIQANQGMVELHIEAVELMDSRPSRTSDEVWTAIEKER